MTHWRRHDGFASVCRDAAMGQEYHATACGRIAHSSNTTSNAQEADCEECAKVMAKPECPYWSDGKHCYTANIGNGAKHVSKWCYCGAEVKPR